MKSNHQAVLGFAAGFIAFILVLGSAAAALVESGYSQQAPPAGGSLQEKAATQAPAISAAYTRPAVSPSSTLSSTPQPSPLPSETPSPTPCPPPQGWISYTVGVSDTLPGLAGSLGITEALVIEANCLVKGVLPTRGLVYLPPSPTPTAAAPTALPDSGMQCQPPSGWVSWVVRPGDTWDSLASATGVGSMQLQAANCYHTNLVSIPGQSVFLPRLPAGTQTAVPPSPSPWSLSTATRPFPSMALTPSTSPGTFPVQPVIPVIKTPVQPSGPGTSTQTVRTATP